MLLGPRAEPGDVGRDHGDYEDGLVDHLVVLEVGQQARRGGADNRVEVNGGTGYPYLRVEGD